MRIAWPELIVLIVVGALVIFGAEIALLLASSALHMSAWLVGPAVIFAFLFDLWAVLRVVDWAFAGPARRRNHRIL